jgi:hypothetical protein
MLIVLEAGKSKIMTLADLVSGKSLLHIDGHLLTITHRIKMVRELSGASFVRPLRPLIPFMMAEPGSPSKGPTSLNHHFGN